MVSQSVTSQLDSMRLQKFLAECGIASRRKCEELIRTGRVKVNDTVAQLGMVVNPASDKVFVDGKPVIPEKKVYILLNKPRGVVTSVRDPHHQQTVIDCLRGVKERVFPVGRLDIDVEGALLLTNDGELAFRLMHPKFQIDKVYLAWVKGHMTAETAMRLEQGIKLEDGIARPSRVVVLNPGKLMTVVEITMREGRKREIKRMCARVGHEVLELRRVSIGNLHIRGMQPGQWRYLKPQEIQTLKQLLGLE